MILFTQLKGLPNIYWAGFIVNAEILIIPFTQLTSLANIYWTGSLTPEILMVLFTQLYTTVIEYQSKIITPKTKTMGFMGLLMKIWDLWDTIKKKWDLWDGYEGCTLRRWSRKTKQRSLWVKI